MITIDVRNMIHSPEDWIYIDWECPCPRYGKASGTTQCKAWQGQGEIDQLVAAGYTITAIRKD